MTTPQVATTGRLQFPRGLSPNAIRPVRMPKFPIAMAISDSGLETRKLDTEATRLGLTGTQLHYHSEIVFVYDWTTPEKFRKFSQFYYEATIGHWRAFEIPQDYSSIWCMLPSRETLHRYFHPLWRFSEQQIELNPQGCQRYGWTVGLVNLKGEDLMYNAQ